MSTHDDILEAVEITRALTEILKNPPGSLDDVRGKLTDDEKTAWDVAAGVGTLVKIVAPNSGEADLASKIIAALAEFGYELHRFIVSGRKIVVECERADILIGKLGPGVKHEPLEN